MSSTRCSNCGRERDADDSSCSACGTRNLVLEAEAGDYFVMGESVSLIHADANNHWLKVNDEKGARSESSLVDDRFRTVVQGPVSAGRPGEPRVRDTLVQALRAAGAAVRLEPGVDRHGEDGILLLGGQRVTLQVTTVPGDNRFWRDANTTPSASTDVPLERASQWVHESLAEKTTLPPGDRAQMLLAVDAAHFGPLASQKMMTLYLSQFGEPREEFGFGAVYIVGPTASSTTRLGAGSW